MNGDAGWVYAPRKTTADIGSSSSFSLFLYHSPQKRSKAVKGRTNRHTQSPAPGSIVRVPQYRIVSYDRIELSPVPLIQINLLSRRLVIILNSTQIP